MCARVSVGACRLGPSCQGNRIEFVPGSNHAKLKANFVHQKIEESWQHMPVGFLLPPSLTDQLIPWVTEGHQMLAPHSRHLFVHPGSGMPWSNSEFWQWWQRLLSVFGAPFRFPPSKLRHIFVSERRSEHRVRGPNDAQAARIMMNSVERWEISYNLNRFSDYEIQAAADAMETWREELLALVPQPVE